MIHFENQELAYLLEPIIQANPFDPTMIVKKTGQQYVFVAANEMAQQAFPQVCQFGTSIAGLFQACDWQRLKHQLAIKIKVGDFYQLLNGGQAAIHIWPIEEVKNYFVLVIRQPAQVLNQLQQQQSFLLHYVDPIISLDLHGRIIGVNHAAQSLAQQQNLIGQSIYQCVRTDCLQQFADLLHNTYEGQPTTMSQCKLHVEYVPEAFYTIQSFPAYYDGKIVGAHLLLKVMTNFFIDHSVFQQIAYQDVLTGLLNRRALQEQWAAYEVNYALSQTAIMLIDLDRFKKFNKSLGKQKTDDLLIMISNRFSEIRSEHCELFRYNGDEFIAVIHFIEQQQVEIIAQEFINTLQEPFIIDEQDYFVTASIGIAIGNKDYPKTLDQLLHEADQAVYFVKKNGRDDYRFYCQEMALSFSNEVLMEGHLKRAIEFQELSVHFQPQFNVVKNRIDSFEALVRWNNRKFGAVSPSKFIPIAESSGIIIEMGYWILEKVCQYQRAWLQKGYRAVRVAVNISPKQFKHSRFVAMVRHLLEKYELDPQYIELEITEGSMMDVEETTLILNELKRIGVYVSVDDFGTGYSSLSYLKSYPIDIIKIDQSFIADIQKDEKNEQIIKAIILLSHTLGLEVIAEGVEDETQAAFLKELQCEKLQGYLYNKAISGEEIEQIYLVGT